MRILWTYICTIMRQNGFSTDIVVLKNALLGLKKKTVTIASLRSFFGWKIMDTLRGESW